MQLRELCRKRAWCKGIDMLSQRRRRGAEEPRRAGWWTSRVSLSIQPGWLLQTEFPALRRMWMLGADELDDRTSAIDVGDSIQAGYIHQCTARLMRLDLADLVTGRTPAALARNLTLFDVSGRGRARFARPRPSGVFVLDCGASRYVLHRGLAVRSARFHVLRARYQRLGPIVSVSSGMEEACEAGERFSPPSTANGQRRRGRRATKASDSACRMPCPGSVMGSCS